MPEILDALERMERKDASSVEVVHKERQDAMATEDAHAEAWARWFDERFDLATQERLIPAVGDALGETRIDMRAEFMALVHKLEVEVAELRGGRRATIARRDSRSVSPFNVA